jgi:hypothetical protein
MGFTAITRAFGQHKRVTISVVLLTLIGAFYALEVMPLTFQAKANVLLISPPTAPTSFEIAQNPALANASNPYLNLGNPTYVADVMATLVSSRGVQQSLAAAGVSPGYQVTVDNSGEQSGQTVAPPALDIVGTGSSAQAAIQSAGLVASTVSNDLRQLQQSEHVQSKFMITAVEYVSPSSAVGSSSGRFKAALEIVVAGVVVLFVAVSIAQALEDRRRGGPHRGRQPSARVDGRSEQAGSQYGESRDYCRTQYVAQQWDAGRLADSKLTGPPPRQHYTRNDGHA